MLLLILVSQIKDTSLTASWRYRPTGCSEALLHPVTLLKLVEGQLHGRAVQGACPAAELTYWQRNIQYFSAAAIQPIIGSAARLGIKVRGHQAAQAILQLLRAAAFYMQYHVGASL